jgi:hypothetical protein
MKETKSIWSDISGQDLIECALVAGFCATAALAIVPGVVTFVTCGKIAGDNMVTFTRLMGVVCAVLFFLAIFIRRGKMDPKE